MSSKNKDKNENKIKQVKRQILKKKVVNLTEGLFSTFLDTTLFALSLPIASFGKRPNSRDVYKTFNEAHQMVEEVNYKKFKQMINTLRNRGLIASIKDWTVKPIITANGRKKLQSLIPSYDSQRIWDGKVYLVNYDFSIKQNRIRDVFRDFLKRLGAIKLQDSLYVCCYNPQGHIENFQKEYFPNAVVLISELGKSGFLGESDLKSFLWKHADLEDANAQYEIFIKKYKNRKRNDSFFKIACSYHSILKNDPQLPFRLLPNGYLGNEAFLVFKSKEKV